MGHGPGAEEGEGERTDAVTSSKRTATVSSALVMLTKVSIASCGGRDMAGDSCTGAGGLGLHGDEVGSRREQERSREAAEPCVFFHLSAADVVLSYCSPLSWAEGRGPRAGPREADVMK
jgi:hypothetical protein